MGFSLGCAIHVAEQYLTGCTIATILSRLRDHIGLHLAPTPAAGNGRTPAGTVKRASFRKAGNRGYYIRPITIGTEGDQVSSETPGAFHAMANSVAHYDMSSENWQSDRGERQCDRVVIALSAHPAIWPRLLSPAAKPLWPPKVGSPLVIPSRHTNPRHVWPLELGRLGPPSVPKVTIEYLARWLKSGRSCADD
jgi:hypothetical protein